MTEPIRKIVTVPLTPQRAFELFTDEMADWWPLDQHSLSAQEENATAKSVEVPQKIGEQVVETKPDGSIAPWGRVTEYAPGSAFGMTWHVGRPEEQASHVRVSFDVVADGTQVTLVHDNWEALGTEATALRAGYFKGWDFVFINKFGVAAQTLRVVA